MQLPEMTLDAIDVWLENSFTSDRHIVAKEGEHGCLVSTYIKWNCKDIGEVSTGYGAFVIQDSPESRAMTEYRMPEDMTVLPMWFDDHLERNGSHSMTRGTARKLISRVRAHNETFAPVA